MRGIDAGYELATLESGVRLITAPMQERASVAVAFMFGVGSRFEDERNSGLAHFIEHMVFKGGRRFPTAKAISEEIEGVGGMLNAETDRESTVFWTRVPGERLSLAVDVLSDMLLHPVVDGNEVAKERLVVLEELRMTEDNPQDHVQTVFDEVMWPDHPLGWDIAGREETVRSFHREQCLLHLGDHYRPDNLVVSIAGAVDHDRARTILDERIVAARSPRRTAQPLPATAAPGHGDVRVVFRKTEQANILVGGRSASLMEPERFAVDLLNALLGEGMSSRLFLELRENQALAYDVHSFTIRLRDTGAVAMYIGCEPGRAEQALAAAVHEMERLTTEPIQADELRRAAEYLKGRLVLGLESTSSMSRHLGQQKVLTGDILSAAEVVEAIDAVTSADVQAAASAVLRGGLRAAIVGPFQHAEGFRRAVGSPQAAA